MNLKDKQKELLTAVYKTREEILTQISENSKAHSFFLDKALLSISSGGLALYLTLFSSDKFTDTKLIQFSSISFLITIVLVLLSFVFADFSFSKQKRLNEARFKADSEAIFAMNDKSEKAVINQVIEPLNLRSFCGDAIPYFNFFSSISCLIGLSLAVALIAIGM